MNRRQFCRNVGLSIAAVGVPVVGLASNLTEIGLEFESEWVACKGCYIHQASFISPSDGTQWFICEYSTQEDMDKGVFIDSIIKHIEDKS